MKIINGLIMSIILAGSLSVAHAKPQHRITTQGFQLEGKYVMEKTWANIDIGALRIYKAKKTGPNLDRVAQMTVDFFGKHISVRLASTTDTRSENATNFKYETIDKSDHTFFNGTFDVENYSFTSVKEHTKNGNKSISNQNGSISADTLDPLTALFYKVTTIDLRKGATTRLKISDAAQKTENLVSFKVTGTETVKAAGKKENCYKVVVDDKNVAFMTRQKGVKVTAWVGTRSKKLLKLHLETPKTGLIKFTLVK